MIVDVNGYFEPGTGQLFHPLTPARILDSRPGTPSYGPFGSPWSARQSRDVSVGGLVGVLPSASAVVTNVTVTDTDASSFLSVFPQGSSLPTVSSLNWVPGETIPNAVTVELSTIGQISMYNLTGHVDVVADVAGWYG